MVDIYRTGKKEEPKPLTLTHGSIVKELESQIEALEEKLEIRKKLLKIAKENANVIEPFIALFRESSNG